MGLGFNFCVGSLWKNGPRASITLIDGFQQTMMLHNLKRAGRRARVLETRWIVALAVAGGHPAPPFASTWPVVVARSVGRAVSSLISRLESNKGLGKFAEWCSQDLRRGRGVAYCDCVVLYDVEGSPDPVTYAVSRDPDANIYVRVEHNLLRGVDPYLRATIERLERVYQQTFWANLNGFVFGQACLALASRGLNINQITIYWGPGGVGRRYGRA